MQEKQAISLNIEVSHAKPTFSKLLSGGKGFIQFADMNKLFFNVKKKIYINQLSFMLMMS